MIILLLAFTFVLAITVLILADINTKLQQRAENLNKLLQRTENHYREKLERQYKEKCELLAQVEKLTKK